MELIPYEQFSKLRLAEFQLDASSISSVANWEFMGGVWVGEAIGFTIFLRPEQNPNDLGSVELDLNTLSADISTAILDVLHLPLRRGFSLEQISEVLGIPIDTKVFVADRKTHDFIIGSCSCYLVSCTIHDRDGLIHVAVLRNDYLRAGNLG